MAIKAALLNIHSHKRRNHKESNCKQHTRYQSNYLRQNGTSNNVLYEAFPCHLVVFPYKQNPAR